MKKLSFLLGILISFFFLYLAFRGVNIAEVIKVIGSAKISYLMLALFTVLLGLIVRSYRWKIITSQYKNLPLKEFFQATNVGLMTNNVLPFRLGDIMQAYFLAYKNNLSKSTVLSTIVLERLFDLIFAGLLIICSSFFILLPRQIGRIRVIVFMSVICIMVFLIFRSKERFIGLVEKIAPSDKIRNNIKRLVENFYTGLHLVKDKKTFINAVLCTVVLWVVYVTTAYLCILSFGLKLTVFGAVIIQCAIALSVIIPSSPGYIGTWEACLILALSIFGILKTQSLGFAMVSHFLSWLPVTVIGLFFFIKSGISFKKIETQVDNNKISAR